MRLRLRRHDPTTEARSPGAADAPRVLALALGRSAALLGLSGATLARCIGLSEASVSRLLAGGRGLDPESKPGELALLLIRLYRSLDALVGNDVALRRAWLESPNKALNGTPRELIQSAQGLVTVVAYLDAMRAPI